MLTMAMNTSITGSRKGQLSIEASIIILFTLLALLAFWVGGPMQKSAEKSTDTNGVVLAAEAIDVISSAVEVVAMGGLGQKREFVIHEPFNCVDVAYNDSPYLDNSGTEWGDSSHMQEGPHMRFSIVTYDKPDGTFHNYFVGPTGRAWWEDPPGRGDSEWPYPTPFYYKNITAPVRFPIDRMPLCELGAMQTSITLRGPSTRFLFIKPETGEVLPMMFCCEAGFNLNMYAEMAFNSTNSADLEVRYYFNAAPPWILT